MLYFEGQSYPLLFWFNPLLVLNCYSHCVLVHLFNGYLDLIVIMLYPVVVSWPNIGVWLKHRQFARTVGIVQIADIVTQVVTKEQTYFNK